MLLLTVIILFACSLEVHDWKIQEISPSSITTLIQDRSGAYIISNETHGFMFKCIKTKDYIGEITVYPYDTSNKLLQYNSINNGLYSHWQTQSIVDIWLFANSTANYMHKIYNEGHYNYKSDNTRNVALDLIHSLCSGEETPIFYFHSYENDTISYYMQSRHDSLYNTSAADQENFTHINMFPYSFIVFIFTESLLFLISVFGFIIFCKKRYLHQPNVSASNQQNKTTNATYARYSIKWPENIGEKTIIIDYFVPDYIPDDVKSMIYNFYFDGIGSMYTNMGVTRLIDYYFAVSCVPATQKFIDDVPETRQQFIEERSRWKLIPRIIDRYPENDYSDTPLQSQWIAEIAMPWCVSSRANPWPLSPYFWCFTSLNVDGSKLYISCCEVYEKLEISDGEPIYIPKTFGFVSHYPYFDAFKLLLYALLAVVPTKHITLEQLLFHYFNDIPPPRPGKAIVQTLGIYKVLLASRNEFDIPILEDTSKIIELLSIMSTKHIVMILKLLLLEKRVIFVFEHYSYLPLICEFFTHLLFPLRWTHLFLPLVPATPAPEIMNRLRQLANNNIPFCIGLEEWTYRYIIRENKLSILKNYTVVSINRDEIVNEKQQLIYLPSLPNSLDSSLGNSVENLIRNRLSNRKVLLDTYKEVFANICDLVQTTNNYIMEGNDNQCFVNAFAQTNAFKSFRKYYWEINPADELLKSIPEYFQRNEIQGKHFSPYAPHLPQLLASHPSTLPKINQKLMREIQCKSNVNKKEKKYVSLLRHQFKLTQETNDFLKQIHGRNCCHTFRDKPRQIHARDFCHTFLFQLD
eukprot:377688_1